MGTIANIKSILQRFGKSICGSTLPDALNDLNRQWPFMRQAMTEVTELPLVLNTTGEAQNIVAFIDRQQFIAAPLRWAVCSGGIRIEPSAENGYVGHVRGKPCANHLGEHAETKPTHYLLRGRAGLTFALADGDVFGYLIDANNQKFVVIFPSDGGGGGGALWAVTQEDAVLDPAPARVGVKICDDAVGTNPHGATIYAVLPSRTDAGGWLPTGSVVSIMLASDGEYTVESDYSAASYAVNGGSVTTAPIVDFIDTPTVTWTKGGSGNRVEYEATAHLDGVIFYAATQENWTDGTPATVRCKIASGRSDTTGSGADITVYLPRFNDGDPNVVAGQTLLVIQEPDSSDYVCISDYMDDPIGTIKMTTSSAAPAGWGLADGIENATGNGGTGVDARRRFLRAAFDSGENATTGGDGNSTSNYRHNHVLSCITAFGDSGAVTNPSTIEFYAFRGTALNHTADGVQNQMNVASGAVWTANEDPMFVKFLVIERLDNSL